MVKCEGCGFLSLKDRHGGGYLEVDRPYREAGAAGGYLSRHAADDPVCFAMAADLAAEVAGAVEHAGPRRMLAVIGRGRDCPKFTPWAIGYGPKETAERVHNSEIVRIAELRLSEDRDCRDRQRREDIERQARQGEDRARREGARDRREFAYKVALVVVTLVVTYVFNRVFTYTGFPPRGGPDAAGSWDDASFEDSLWDG